MDNCLKLKDKKTLEVKFTPRTMARFQAETKFGTGYFMNTFAQLQDLLSPVIKGGELTQEAQIGVLNLVGFNDVKYMIFAGCAEVETLQRADEILDELEGGLFQNLQILILGFTKFMNGDLLGVVEEEETPAPLEKMKPEKLLKKAKNPEV